MNLLSLYKGYIIGIKKYSVQSCPLNESNKERDINNLFGLRNMVAHDK